MPPRRRSRWPVPPGRRGPAGGPGRGGSRRDGRRTLPGDRRWPVSAGSAWESAPGEGGPRKEEEPHHVSLGRDEGETRGGASLGVARGGPGLGGRGLTLLPQLRRLLEHLPRQARAGPAPQARPAPRGHRLPVPRLLRRAAPRRRPGERRHLARERSPPPGPPAPSAVRWPPRPPASRPRGRRTPTTRREVCARAVERRGENGGMVGLWMRTVERGGRPETDAGPRYRRSPPPRLPAAHTHAYKQHYRRPDDPPERRGRAKAEGTAGGVPMAPAKAKKAGKAKALKVAKAVTKKAPKKAKAAGVSREPRRRQGVGGQGAHPGGLWLTAAPPPPRPAGRRGRGGRAGALQGECMRPRREERRADYGGKTSPEACSGRGPPSCRSSWRRRSRP